MRVPVEEALPVSAIAHLVRTEPSPAEQRRIIAGMACELPWDVGLGVLHELAGTTPHPGLDSTVGEDRSGSALHCPRKRQRAARLWSSPPPPGMPERMDGLAVLDDYDGPLGIVLWQSVRDVLLWASIPRECRDGLFCTEALARRHTLLDSIELPPHTDVWITALSAVVLDPPNASRLAIGTACVELCGIAATEGRTAAALSLARAAAAALPSGGAPALQVGRVALASGDHDHSESWLRWALHLARRSGDGTIYGEAALELGHLALNCGEGERARRYFSAAGRGTPDRLLSTRAGAAWGLYVIAMRWGPLEEAEKHARRAAKLFGAGSSEAARMQLDLAALRIRLGKALEARSLLKRLLRNSITSPLRPRALALLSHAAALLNDRRTYACAWKDAASVIQQAESSAPVAEELARAARAVGDTQRTRMAERLGAAPARNHSPQL